MASTHGEVRSILSVIENIRLPHPSGPLLSSFVTEALNPVLAARYVKERLSAEEAPSLVSDWTYIVECTPDATTRRDIARRDGGKCCVTGKAGVFWDPLLVLPILPVPAGWITDEKPWIFDMLGVFFGPPYRDWWLSYARNPEFMSPFHNHWLIRKSAAGAFTKGFIRLDRSQSSMIEYEVNHVLIGPESPIGIDGAYPLLGDHSRSGIQKVDPRFVGTHARLSRSIRFLDIAKKIAPEVSPRPSESLTNPPALHLTLGSRAVPRELFRLSSPLTRVLLAVWLILPSKIRIAAYELLRRLGRLLYGEPNEYSTVQRLPFGLYLKYQGELDGFRNEFNALLTVRRHTSIPAPAPLDVVSKQDADEPFSSPGAYLLITRVPGIPLWQCYDVMSDRDCEQVASQMKDYLAQLRDIPKTVNPDMAICNTLGEACRDTRIQSEDPVGPFPDEAAFSQVLRFSDDPGRRGHKIVFSHADLNPRNILVDHVAQADGRSGWRVTGIVDWENSGYYPEYWDYTKAMFEGFRWPWRYNDLMKGVFATFGDYSQEYAVEKRSWESGDGI